MKKLLFPKGRIFIRLFVVFGLAAFSQAQAAAIGSSTTSGALLLTRTTTSNQTAIAIRVKARPVSTDPGGGVILGMQAPTLQ